MLDVSIMSQASVEIALDPGGSEDWSSLVVGTEILRPGSMFGTI